MSQFYKNSAGGGGASSLIIVTGTTTGAMTSIAKTFPLLPNQSVSITVLNVLGFDNATPNSLGQVITGNVYRASGSAILNSVPAKLGDTTFSTASCDIINSGNDAAIQLTGQAGLTINWKILLSYIYS